MALVRLQAHLAGISQSLSKNLYITLGESYVNEVHTKCTICVLLRLCFNDGMK